MSDGAPGIVLIFNYIVFKDDFYFAITSAQEMLFPNSRRLVLESYD